MQNVVRFSLQAEIKKLKDTIFTFFFAIPTNCNSLTNVCFMPRLVNQFSQFVQFQKLRKSLGGISKKKSYSTSQCVATVLEVTVYRRPIFARRITPLSVVLYVIRAPCMSAQCARRSRLGTNGSG